MGTEAQRVLYDTCRALLRIRDEASVSNLALQVHARYEALDQTGKADFFAFLLAEFSADEAGIHRAIKSYQASPTPVSAQHLSIAAESPRQELFRLLNIVPGGTKSILAMRADCLALRDHDLAPVEFDLEHLLGAWFNRGFLRLERIDSETSANVLEQLIAFEAVHEIRDWDDLQRRLAPDRRCFGFFHPALPGEVLIFVEVALTTGLADSIQAVIDAPGLDAAASLEHFDTAIFYSITNCQAGLRGIPLGSFLLKQVTHELATDLPQLTRFSTLSPVPTLVRWVTESGRPTPATSDGLRAVVAQYLLHAKVDGFPADAVARFHLRNGARLERINLDGDTSPKGMNESFGVLVNYVYDPAELAENHEAYVNAGVVAHSPEVGKLLNDAS